MSKKQIIIIMVIICLLIITKKRNSSISLTEEKVLAVETFLENAGQGQREVKQWIIIENVEQYYI